MATCSTSFFFFFIHHRFATTTTSTTTWQLYQWNVHFNCINRQRKNSCTVTVKRIFKLKNIIRFGNGCSSLAEFECRVARVGASGNRKRKLMRFTKLSLLSMQSNPPPIESLLLLFLHTLLHVNELLPLNQWQYEFVCSSPFAVSQLAPL